MADDVKTRVIIVDDVAETRENVRKLLQFESDIDVIGVARTGREAVQICQELLPDVVLMDINMPDMDGITATEQIRQKMPQVKVIILSVQGDQNYMRRAMLVGASDFLTKPPMADELIAALRRAGAAAREEKARGAHSAVMPGAGTPQSKTGMPHTRGKTIMIYSPKGGSGSTTLAVNLAIALHNEDTHAIVVDANLQYGDVAVFLNEQPKSTILDLTPIVDELDPSMVDETVVKHSASGLHILPAPMRPENAEKVTAEQVSKLIQYLRQLYAYVVVDTATYLNDITLSVLDVSDVMILVVTQDIPAIKNGRLFLDLLTTLGIPQSKIAFVMNKYDKRITITPEKVGENLKLEVAAVIPLDERIVVPSINRGVPFVIDNKTQPVARGIYTLAETLRARFLSEGNDN